MNRFQTLLSNHSCAATSWCGGGALNTLDMYCKFETRVDTRVETRVVCRVETRVERAWFQHGGQPRRKSGAALYTRKHLYVCFSLALLVSAFETMMRYNSFTSCFQFQLVPLHHGSARNNR